MSFSIPDPGLFLSRLDGRRRGDPPGDRAMLAFAMDAKLRDLARATVCLQRLMMEGLARLAEGDRLMALGYAGIGDYAVQRLGFSGSHAEELALMGRRLREATRVDELFREGRLTYSATRLLLRCKRRGSSTPAARP